MPSSTPSASTNVNDQFGAYVARSLNAMTATGGGFAKAAHARSRLQLLIQELECGGSDGGDGTSGKGKGTTAGEGARGGVGGSSGSSSDSDDSLPSSPPTRML